MNQNWRQRPRPDGACEKNKESVFRMSETGCSLAAIGRAVGTTGRHVHRFLRYYGKDRHFPTAKPGKDHPEWKGGRRVRKDGYVRVLCPGHPHASKYGQDVYEHRLVMENHIGRYLDPGEVVHHKNKKPSDNRIENLELFSSNGKHLSKERTGLTPNWTIEGIHRMQESAARRAKHPRSKIHRGLKRDVFESP